MTWGRVDDSLYNHPKRLRAGLEAMGLWLAGFAYCGLYSTDGYLDAAWFEREVPAATRRKKLVNTLVSSGLLEPMVAGEVRYFEEAIKGHGRGTKAYKVQVGPFDSDGFLIHDYLDYNPCRSRIEEKREEQKQAKRDQRDRAKEGAGL